MPYYPYGFIGVQTIVAPGIISFHVITPTSPVPKVIAVAGASILAVPTIVTDPLLIIKLFPEAVTLASAVTVTFPVPKTSLVLGTGNVTVTADANVTASGNNLIIRSGSVTIVGTASISAPATPLTLRTGEVGVITWNEIIPGATMVWTPIKPYG